MYNLFIDKLQKSHQEEAEETFQKLHDKMSDSVYRLLCLLIY